MDFTRKPKPETIATSAEIQAAAKALVNGDNGPTDELAARAGADSRRVAAAILDATIDQSTQETDLGR